MKVTTVNSKDLTDKKKNPARCMSALRGNGECHKCEKIATELNDTPLDLLLKNLNFTCKPRISPDIMKDLEKYDALLSQRELLQNDIHCLGKHLGLL